MGLLNAGSAAGVYVGPRRLQEPYTVMWVISSTAAAPMPECRILLRHMVFRGEFCLPPTRFN